MSRIFDNIELRFVKGLHDALTNVGIERADFCTGYFNLRGWGLVASDIEKLPGGEVLEPDDTPTRRLRPIKRVCRLLVGMQRAPQEDIRDLYDAKQIIDQTKASQLRRRMAAEFRKQLTIGVPTTEDEQTLRTLKKQLIAGKVCVKLHLRHPLHAKLYLAHRPHDTSNPIISLMGSSNLTFAGLHRNAELDAEFGDYHDNQQFKEWFDARWNDIYSLDITQDLIKILDECWASENGPTPYEIYLKIMYLLSREAREGDRDYTLPAPFNTELFEYQKTAVKLAVRHLEKRGGAMIGDVVGLGKTITASAIAKIYEVILGGSTLVLCPPKLVDMWESYADHYDLKMTVRSIAAPIDPPNERFYRLVIIDESHNLRNGAGSRYETIKGLLDYQNNKVLLLTATPYNKDFTDLGHQLELFVSSDEDLGIRPERQIEIEGGEQKFSYAHNGISLSSIDAFNCSEQADDWRDLMKLYLVRRTRTFIRRNYALHDPATNRDYLVRKDGSRTYFPDRLPKTLEFKTSDMYERLYSDESVTTMGDLCLPRYGLQKYLTPDASSLANAKEKDLLDNLSRAGKRMMGFCLSSFFKRMDSSGLAFLMSIYRHIVRNCVYFYAIKNNLPLPIGGEIEQTDGYDADDESGEIIYSFPIDEKHYQQKGQSDYNFIRKEQGDKIKWIRPSLFKKSLATDLRKDIKLLLQILSKSQNWISSQDGKLSKLIDLIAKKHADEKILVFTQYTDTANYLTQQLRSSLPATHIDEVVGNSENILSRVRYFSPNSNDFHGQIPTTDETRVMIATDALSEGQNLQDAHIVVNYDMPWAIIRLIQRAGRVDRIGQQSEKVYCYSFFPQDGIDKAIRLREKLSNRIREMADTVGSDEIFFEGNAQNLKDLFNEKAGILDDEADNGEVDIASQAYQIWDKATKNNPELAQRIQSLPDVVYSTKPAAGEKTGVVTYARTRSESDILAWLDTTGTIISRSPTRILDALACDKSTPTLPPLPNHHALVKSALTLAQEAIQSGTIGGALGSRMSTRARAFKLLQQRLQDTSKTLPLFEQDLKFAADAIYARPLLETTKLELGRLFHQKAGDDAIIQTILERYRDDELCISAAPEDLALTPAAHIICSMGFSDNNN